tara:strand:+ start:773 stop:1678 length:906 start_codon:yes stop_codon:yes gene_type:complete
MFIKETFKRLLKGLLISSIGFSSSILLPQGVKAEDFSFEECPDPGTTNATIAYIRDNLDGICLHTPSKYELTIYEMGLCTSHPLTGAVGSKVFDKTTCIQTLVSTTGSVVDLAPGSSSSKTASLPASATRPASNSYGFAYILLSTEFNLKGSYELSNGTTYYSKKGTDEDGFEWGEADSSLTAAQGHKDTINNFYFEEGDGWDAEMTDTSFGGGTVAALLLKECSGATCEGTDAKATSISDTKRLLGVFTPSSPVVITNTTKGVEVELVVKKGGYLLELNDGGDEINGFGSAPFKPVFTLF